jgi:hypothetical protein
MNIFSYGLFHLVLILLIFAPFPCLGTYRKAPIVQPKNTLFL